MNYNEDDTAYINMRKALRSLLFHVSAMLDVNECEIDFFNEYENSEKDYRRNLYDAVIRGAIELNKDLGPKIEALRMMLKLFHDQW